MKTLSLACLALVSFWTLSAPASEPIGKVLSVNGKVWAKEGGKRRELQVGGPLFKRDKIQTEKGADITVKLGNDAAVKLKNQAEVTFEKSSDGTWTLELRQGGAISYVSNPKKKPNLFTIRTRAATMGVRGTVFFVQAEGKDTFLCTCNGKVAVSGVNGKETVEIESKHHDFPKRIGSGSAPLAKRMTEAQMGTDHSDPEAAEVVQAFNDAK